MSLQKVQPRYTYIHKEGGERLAKDFHVLKFDGCLYSPPPQVVEVPIERGRESGAQSLGSPGQPQTPVAATATPPFPAMSASPGIFVQHSHSKAENSEGHVHNAGAEKQQTEGGKTTSNVGVDLRCQPRTSHSESVAETKKLENR